MRCKLEFIQNLPFTLASLFLLILFVSLSYGKDSRSPPEKPRGFIPTLDLHWFFLSVDCEGRAQNSDSESTELIRHRDGLLDNLLPKRKKKNKRKHRNEKRALSNYEEEYLSRVEEESPTSHEDEGFFASKLFEDVDKKNPSFKSVNLLPSDDRNIFGKKEGNYNEGKIEINEGNIGGAKHIHLNVNCPEASLADYAINTTVSHLIVTTDGELSVGSQPLQKVGDLSYLKMWSLGGLDIPKTCSWLPETVRTLDLSHSVLRHGNFTDCSAPLESLSIAGTSIHSLQFCLPLLKSLAASWNNLKTFIQECSGGSDSVSELDFSQNRLRSWSSCGWPNVTHVNLVYNELSHIDLVTCSANKLFDLKLAYNRIAKFPSYLPTSLTYLDLSNNKLRKMHIIEAPLQTLSLSHNELATLGKRSFRYASQLLTLDLSYNNLVTLYGHYFTGLRELRSLDLSYNSIQDIKHEAFRALRKIRKLSLVGNKLNQLDPRLLAGLPKGLHLEAHDNPWSCSCHLLASLSHATRAHCKSKPCHKPHEKLQCEEGDFKMDFEDVLKQCLRAVEGLQTPRREGNPAVELRNPSAASGVPSSDEDLSEEAKDPDDLPLVVIPGVLLIVILPIVVVIVRNIYVRRKQISKKWCRCFEPSRPEVHGAHTLSPWRNTSTQIGEQKDSDSETEL